MKKIILSLVLTLTVIACNTVKNTTSNNETKTQATLENTEWVLAEQVKGKTPTIIISSDKINGNAGCNNYFGTVNWNKDGGLFSTKGIASTRMACPNMSTEDNFLKMLSQANKYKIKGDNLELYKDELLLLKLHKVAK